MRNLLFTLLLALGACDAESSSPTAAEPDSSDALRSPPGDWFAGTAGVSMVVGIIDDMARVDGAAMNCPDGTVSDTCVIDDFDTSPARLDPAVPEPDPLVGMVIYHGSPAIVGGDAVLRANQVWGQLIDPASQSTLELQADAYLLRDTSIACFAAPCPIYAERDLTAGTSGTFAELDFSVSGASQKEIDAALAAANGPDGLVVEGSTYQVVGPAGVADGLTVFRFWKRVPKL
jgi:hypothetical protein